MTVHDGGISVFGGLSVLSAGVNITNGMTISSGGAAIYGVFTVVISYYTHNLKASYCVQQMNKKPPFMCVLMHISSMLLSL